VSSQEKLQSGAAARVDERDHFASGQTENVFDAALGKHSGERICVCGHTVNRTRRWSAM
jgi:hypothetical protein